MDSRCKAILDKRKNSYICKKCSKDCLINKAISLAEKYEFDYYVVPGGSCIPKIIAKKKYNIAIGVACPYEIKLGFEKLKNTCEFIQGISLTKNGCANTKFNLSHL